MRVTTLREMRDAEAIAISEGTPALALMEAAGEGAGRVARELLSDDPRGKNVWVFAGKGNNGGDGFVVARRLKEWGAEVHVVSAVDPVTIAGDAATNLRRLAEFAIEPLAITDPSRLGAIGDRLAHADLCVDALLGTGFSGEVTGSYRALIEHMNESDVPVLALDIPSGLHGDTGHAADPTVRALITATFGAPKLGLLLYPGRTYAGNVRVIDIGIADAIWQRVACQTWVVTPELAEADLPRRRPDAHKGDCGRVTVIGGSPGLTGAVVLTSNAALRAGAGLVTAAVPAGLQDILAIKLTEVMTRALPETPSRTLAEDAASELLPGETERCAYALGPGLSRAPGAAAAARTLGTRAMAPVVIDADGLNAFEGAVDLLRGAKAPRILTPHLGEASRLLGRSASELARDPLQAARELATRSGAIAVLKGAPTIVATPRGEAFINTTGNAGLATGGSGDVLTGLIASFLAQGCEPLAAARLGVYVHGLAADLGASHLTEWGLIAGDVVSLVPEALAIVSSGDDTSWIY